MLKTRDMDMTKGRVLPRILKFAFPLIFTNLLQCFYNVADSIIVSFSSQPDAVGAIGTTPGFINFVLNLFIGCSVGAKVLTASRLGAGEEQDAKRSAGASIALSVILGIMCAVVSCIAAPGVLSFMGNRGKLLALSLVYVRIYFSGIPFIAVTNFSTALLHARGDTRTPLYVLAFSGIANVVLNSFFVFVLNMTVEGVALATLAANGISAVFLLKRVFGSYGIGFRDLKFCRFDVGEILKIGMPAGIQGAIFSVSQMMIQSSIVTVNNLSTPIGAAYEPVVKGCAACTNLESFAASVTVSLGQVAVPFVSQNCGSGNFERIKKIRTVMYGVTFVLSTLVAWALMLFAEPLLSLFGIFPHGDSLSRLAYASAIIRMKYMFIPYCFLGFMEVGAGVVQGLKKTNVAAVTSLTGSCLLRVVWLLTLFKMSPSLEMIFITFPISWFITAVAHFVAANVVIKRVKNNS